MELSTIQNPSLVVALDIGSTYSGYAWQWRKDFLNNRSNVEFNTNWGAGSLQLHKTTSCILLDKNFKVDSFGNLAETRFCNLCDETDGDVRGKWFFFKKFKIVLYGKNFREDLMVEDYLGQQRSIMEVMTKLIEALKDHFIKNLKEKGHTVNLNETLWVVTVPAIWSEKAKKFMRDAAQKSGIHKKHLLLAHEPECAALYCMHLPAEQKLEMNNFGGTGDKFLTVDLGGGTLDMLAVEVLEDGQLKEICAGQGSRVGGQDVNNAFFQACKDVVEGTAWHELGSRNAEELLVMENDFENRKVQIGSGDERDEQINVPIPPSMRDMMKDGTVKIKPGCEKSKYFKIEKGKLMFNSSLIRDVLFEETVGLILAQMKQILDQKEVKHITTIVLVGGFAESQIVVDKIRALLSENYPKVKAVVPTSPFKAVLKGAVLYGHDPLIFRSRISRATLGVGTNTLFDPEKHDESKKWYNDEDKKEYCKDKFSIHVRKDQSVKLQEKQPSWIYNPMYEEQTSLGLHIFSSPEQEPKYTTDDGCMQIGTITVDMSDTSGGTSRKVKVEMVYGGTQLNVIATDETTGTEYPAEIKFDAF